MGAAARPVLEALHAAGSAVWLAGVAAGAITAAVAFPLMRELRPTLGAFEAYTGDHANLAAGQVASRVFLIGDAAQLAGAAVAMVSTIGLVVSGGLVLARLSTAVRLLALGAALLLLAYLLFVLGPDMGARLRSYWDAAAIGNMALAESSREAFGRLHGGASAVYSGLGLTTLVLIAASGWSAAAGWVAAGGGATHGTGAGAQAGVPVRSRTEEPALARGRR